LLTPKRELRMRPEWHSKIPLMRNGCQAIREGT
jgi:hypothetical protein